MYDILNKINSPEDLRKLSIDEQKKLAVQIREFLIENLSKTGGHLASNLGVVELTIALHFSFDTPNDKIVWDVGHQSYVHKILTGRRKMFNTLRTYGGLSGFPKTSESEYDVFNTGHSSTSISSALGIARAMYLSGENNKAVAVIGDGSLTGGLAYEALADAGHSSTNVIIILNDNDMSISKNVGSMANYLSKIRNNPSYYKTKEIFIDSLKLIPKYGNRFASYASRAKEIIKRPLVPKNLFNDLGFAYLGPIDGHDLVKLNAAINHAKTFYKSPVLIHVITKKGKGYLPAEIEPQNYHGVSAFKISCGAEFPIDEDYSAFFGKTLCEIAQLNKKIVAITPAMPLGSGLCEFSKRYPRRFFDVGIAEGHAVTMSAGLAVGGCMPVCVVYSSFLQRAYDEILHDVCLQNLHIVFAVDRAGVVGADGETHQGIFDISFLSHMPNMSIVAPTNFDELSQMLDYAINTHNAPIAIRYPRGTLQAKYTDLPFEIGKSVVIKTGSDITILAVGNMLCVAMNVSTRLAEYGICAEVISVRTVKPLDVYTIGNSIKKTKKAITIEDNVIVGGFGSLVASMLAEENIVARLAIKGFPSEPITHGTVNELYKLYSLDEDSLLEFSLEFIKEQEM